MRKLWFLFALAMILIFAPTERLAAQSFETLYTFYGGILNLNSTNSQIEGNGDGAFPLDLIQASDGYLYGTTELGSPNGWGSVFRISTDGDLTTLYSFSSDENGEIPDALLQGNDGNLYGTTFQGGAYSYGTVFRISTGGDLTTLYSFTGGDDGENPGGLVQANDGNLYGTTFSGGADGWGTVFRISMSGDLTTLYSFTGGDDGGNSGSPSFAPVVVFSLIQASDGNLYGITDSGGANGYGTLFGISTSGDFNTLYSFTGGDDGAYPSFLMQASDGNLYGTTWGGGSIYTNGTVFQISLDGDLTTLYSFTGDADGAGPLFLVQASDNNLYGTAFEEGTNSWGTVFRISMDGDFTTLYSFSGGDDAGNPSALLQGNDGNLYGVATFEDIIQLDVMNGTNFYNVGTVFSISLPHIAASSLGWNADISGWPVTFGYAADASLPNDTTAELYWADGTDVSNVISTNPVWVADIPAGFIGQATILVPATALQNPPSGTSNLLFVVDPDNVITPANPATKTLALKWVELGVDVSHFQNDAGAINWSSVKSAGAAFAFVQASQGTNATDKNFIGNIQGAFSAGLFVAPYHLAGTGGGTTNSPLVLGDPVAEASNFLNQSGRYIGNGYLPPMLDLEGDFSGDDVRYQNPTGMSFQQWVTTWLQYLQQQTGVVPGIYTTKPALTNLNSLVGTNTLWIANASGSPIVTPSSGTNVWSNWNFQQWSTNGSCLGISGNVDLDSFNGDLAALNALTVNAVSSNSFAVYFSGAGGGNIQAPKNGQFQLQAFAPGQSQLTIQASGDLVHWTDIGTVSVVNGTGIFTDMSAGGSVKFYRVKP